MTQPDLMTMKEVAAYMRTPLKTLRHWRYTGQGPRFARVGRRLLARRSDVDAWLNQQFEQGA